MAKRVIVEDEIFGKMVLDNKSNIWKVNNSVLIPISNKKCEVAVEVDVYNSIYINQKYGLFNSEIIEFNKKHPELLREDYAIECEKAQKSIYKKLILDNLESTAKSIEEAAITGLEEILVDVTEKDLIADVGTEKAHKILAAKTREEKLESLVLKRMRVFRERIEITCVCDWYKHSGGFSIEPNGDATMLSLDSMGI